jgi:GT2 family glycosyltransferase
VSPDLSIVIPSHNRPHLLRQALRSVRSHAPSGTEIVVVDDGSPQEKASAVAAEFPAVHCLRLPKRRGFCAAANQGIRAASGRIVELLNDDTVVSEGWAKSALRCFRQAEIGAVATLVLNQNDGTVDSAGDSYYVGGIASKRGHGRQYNHDLMGRARPVFGASASSSFYRRDALLQVGAFPESFGAYFEDVDLSFRLRRAGWRIVFQPQSRVYHHISSSYGPPHGRLLEQQAQNEERVFWRNLPASTLARALPKHLAVLVAKAGLRFQEGNMRPFLCGKLRILGELPDLLRHRRWLKTLGSPGSAFYQEIEYRYRVHG